MRRDPARVREREWRKRFDGNVGCALHLLIPIENELVAKK